MSKEDRVTREMRIQHENKTKFDNIINKTPMLKKLKDQSNGLKYKGDIVSSGFGDNYDQINWGKKLNSNKSYRVKVNGVYIDEDHADD